MKTKTCSKCNVEKELSEFYKHKKYKDGLRCDCKECVKVYQEQNKKQISEYQKNYHQNNKAKHKQYKEEYYEQNKEQILIQNKEIRENNPEKFKQKSRKNYLKNKVKILRYQKEYSLRNKDKIKEYSKDYFQINKQKINNSLIKRRKTDIDFKLTHYLRCRIRRVLKGIAKSDTTKILIGCSIEFLKKHLESQFQPGMSWDNHSVHGWHIDHKRPCASFDMSKPEEQRKCFHYTNLQPLFAIDNLKKGSKY